ncbi:hypothetical protein HNQ60_001314 [Povalibacter uvarum]|uniref:Uncharacterized protein n=1 Tax=Povalibacter uvarum TaxID=732238 RepID=A0A841HI15_9GAMM|nr:hypothetical protein [Povalibacter uvarum]MBB6092436.1 hypothetical protein [Povalibacter uvarum]
MATRRFSILSTLMSNLRKKDSQEPARTASSRYQAIAIFRGAVCCSIARRFSEHRFLAREAPALPLNGCTMPERCECRYLKFKDRRTDSRRLDGFSAATRLYALKERRGVRGRRSTD